MFLAVAHYYTYILALLQNKRATVRMIVWVLMNTHNFRYAATGEYAPFYVMAGMMTVAVAMAFHTMKQQLVHSPGVSINKKRRESIAEVDDPDTVVADASKFLKKSFLRKVAHIQEHNPTLPDPTRANAITKYLYFFPLISFISVILILE